MTIDFFLEYFCWFQWNYPRNFPCIFNLPVWSLCWICVLVYTWKCLRAI